jgi:hypothetical protein
MIKEVLKSAKKKRMIKRLWDSIRENRGSGKKPTQEMLKQERKIKKESK